MNELQDRLGYRFHEGRLLQAALTHPSFAAEHRAEHYQRLEFLGDAVLELIASRFLYDLHPEAEEGELTRMRAERVREESLALVAQRMDLGAYIRLSAGEARCHGAEKPSILSDVLEAVIGAMYLDGGLAAAESFVRREVLSQEPPAAARDAKSQLHEAVHQSGRWPRSVPAPDRRRCGRGSGRE